MITKGIRIEDDINNIISVKLKDILEEIQNEDRYIWSIQFLYGRGHLSNGKSMTSLEKEILKSQRGIFINWDELNELAICFEDLWGIKILGCEEEKKILRYKNDRDMYESCNIVIELIDSAYWEIFSKDFDFIERLSKKFKKTQFLMSDFEK